ncbi:MAG TPA: toll/interleukin-1 receptor domain-containing protein [Thermoanaerobaculia bacterium]|nr:toll/interleukin-1 receptor domain-containing protein [Thermoanaerobaculia bacterium]
MRVFLCHSSEDKQQVRQLYRRLKDAGLEVWFDEESLLPGQDWQFEITAALTKSHVVLVCLASGSAGRTGFFQKEIKHALEVAETQSEGTIFIIPLRIEDCPIPEGLRRWHRVDYFDPKGFERLIRALHRRAETLGLPMPTPEEILATCERKERDREESAPLLHFLEDPSLNECLRTAVAGLPDREHDLIVTEYRLIIEGLDLRGALPFFSSSTELEEAVQEARDLLNQRLVEVLVSAKQAEGGGSISLRFILRFLQGKT